MDSEQPSTIGQILHDLRSRLPDVKIERLKPKWPADDDNLWYVRLSDDSKVQIECLPDGDAPFLIEGDGARQRLETADADEAVDTIIEWLSAR